MASSYSSFHLSYKNYLCGSPPCWYYRLYFPCSNTSLHPQPCSKIHFCTQHHQGIFLYPNTKLTCRWRLCHSSHHPHCMFCLVSQPGTWRDGRSQCHTCHSYHKHISLCLPGCSKDSFYKGHSLLPGSIIKIELLQRNLHVHIFELALL